MKYQRWILVLVSLIGFSLIGCSNTGKENGKTKEISPPVNLEAIPGDGSVLLTWSPNTEENLGGYNVYYGTESGVYGPPINVGNVVVDGQLSFRVTGLTNGQIYFFALTAYDKNGKESAFSVERSAIPQVLLGDRTPPSSPRNLTATPGNGMVELIWSPNSETDIFVYEVLYGTSAGVYGEPINAGNVVASDGFVHYVVTGLTNGQIYYFTCRAVDTSGNRSGNAIERSAIPQVLAGDMTPPAAPENLVAIPGDGFVDLQWSANTEEDLFGYRVWFKVAGGNYELPLNVGNVTSYRVTGLTNGTQYVFAVSALDLDGNESSLSIERSAIPTAGLGADTTPPAAPGGLWVIGGNGVAQAGWQANTEADLSGYFVYWGTTSQSYSNFLNVGNRTTWRFTGLTVGQTYYFNVRAYDTSGNLSPYAVEVSAVITANATLHFTEQLDERITFTTLTADIPTRLVGGQVTAESITQVCWNSDVVGWYPNSVACVDFNQGLTDTTITNLPTDSFKRLKGNFAAIVNGQARYFDLTLWQTDPFGGIWSDGQGGLEINITFEDLPPSAPENVTAAPGNSEAIISWQANTENDLAGYRVHYGTASGIYGFHLNVGNTTGYILEGLTNGVTYYIVITAYDRNAHESGYSAEVSVTPNASSGPDTTPPLIPQNLVAEPGDSLVDLYWSTNLDPDLASYRVYWGTQPGSYPNVISGITTTSQSITGLTNGVMYFFAVSAVDTSGNESQLSVERSAIPNGPIEDLTPPNHPVNLVATPGDGVISLQWSENLEPDIGGYKIYYGTAPGSYGAPIDVGNQTNYRLQGLINGTTYYIALTAYDNSPNRNESGYSTEVTATPQANLPPAAPTGLTAVAGDGFIDLAWNANSESDLAGYKVHYGTASGVYNAHLDVGNVLVTRLQSLVNGTTYYIVVTAYDLAGNESSNSEEVNATPNPGPDTTPPAKPQNLSAQPGDALVDLYWSTNIEPDLASYTVYWGTQPGVYPNVISGVTQPNRQVTGLTNGVRYYFAVSAVDTSGNESQKSIERSAVPNGTIPDTTPPDPPVNLVCQGGNQVVNCTWSPNLETDLHHYNIRWGTAHGVYGSPINTGTVTNYQIIGLTNGITYYIVVTAVDTSNNESNYSQEVTAVPTAGGGDTTPPNPPTGLSVTATGDGSVDLSWNANTEPDFWGYKLYYGTSSRNYTTTLNLGNRLSYQVTGLTNGTTYYFALTAYDTSMNESGYSNEVTGVPSGGGGGGDPPPSMPTGFTCSSTIVGQIDCSWNPNPEPDLAGYKICYGDTPSDFPQCRNLGKEQTSTSFAGFLSGSQKCLIVQARDLAGQYSVPAGPICLIVK